MKLGRNQLLDAVRTGALDSVLDDLVAAARDRRRTLDRLAAIENAALPRGTRVELHGLRPKYLNGLTGEVAVRRAEVHNKPDRISVTLDDSSYEYLKSVQRGRHRYPQTVTMPANCVRTYN